VPSALIFINCRRLTITTNLKKESVGSLPAQAL